MAKLPLVALIGRPNTGKSTLFNRLLGRRRAIVSDTPGTTRDHITARIEGDTVSYLLIDTGGMGGGTADEDFEDDVHAQSLLALEHADVILFVVDSREELTKSDYEIVDLLRKKPKRHVPVFLVLTKCDDTEKIEEALPQFAELSIGEETFPVSAPHDLGIDELAEAIEESLKALHFQDKEESTDDSPRIAIVGRPNVGKSSIVNALMSDGKRAVSPRLVSDVPGTTRDSVDTVVRYHEKDYVFIDTAGFKRRKQVKSDIEAYAVLRALRAVEDADVTILVLDATREIVKQDKHIAGLAIERGAGLIIVVNKIDLLDADQKKGLERDIGAAFPFCRFAPLLFCSAETKENLSKLFDLIEAVSDNRQRRIETSALNKWFQDLQDSPQGAQICSGGAGTKYVTQAEVAPPTFVLFVRDAKKLSMSNLRYLENRLRETFAFEGTPVRWVKKGRES